MLYEYAVEPRAIGASWEAFRYVVEKFGFDKGRLISQFPKSWFREVYEAAESLLPVQKKRIEEALNFAKRNKVVRSSRPYDPAAGTWLQNALGQHLLSPFHAIIAADNPGAQAFVLPIDHLDELHPLMAVPHDCEANRRASALAEAMTLMLRFGSRILFVDAYYDPFSLRYQRTLRECLRVVESLNPGASCEIHHLDRPGQPGADAIEREAKNLFGGVIPAGMTISIYRWREKSGGADFHARYLLTDKGGIRVDAGFSAEGAHQKTDMALMDFALSQAKREALGRDADIYEIVEPVLQIAPNGYVDRL
jgi:hypothetical protein